MPQVELRTASAGDLDGLVELAEQRRVDCELFQPRFWRRAKAARIRQRQFFSSLLTDLDVLVVVVGDAATIHGFAIARLVSSPPVYDPGGLTCLVDDFTVSSNAEWPERGLQLLEAVRSWGAERGAVQLVVVTAHLDAPKRETLTSAGLSIASEWWVGAIRRA